MVVATAIARVREVLHDVDIATMITAVVRADTVHVHVLHHVAVVVVITTATTIAAVMIVVMAVVGAVHHVERGMLSWRWSLDNTLHHLHQH